MPDSQLAQHRQPRDSLATKIIFFVFVSTFVTALVVSWISVHSTYSFLRAQLNRSYPSVLALSDAGLSRWLEEGQAAIAELAAREELIQAVRGDAGSAERAGSLLAEALRAQDRPMLAALVVRGAAGQVQLRAGTSAEAIDVLEHAPHSLDAPALRAIGSTPVALAPLRDANGERAGTLLAAFSEVGLVESLRGQLAAGSGVVYLVDARGRALAAAPASDGARFDAFPADLLARAPGDAAFEFRAADGRRGIGGHIAIDGHHGIRGGPAETGLGGLADAGWSLVVAQPLERAFAPVFSVVTRIFAIDLAIILLFSFLAYEITAAIVGPLEALSEGARHISQGELEVEVPETATHDEIGLLTRTFNDMARRLRRNRSEIEHQHRQLREQNDALQRANEVLEQLSITDGLTKLHNHRYFQETLTREIKRVSRTGELLAMLLIDIDDFKALNDRLGHAEGDALLVRIARILNESVRESDVLARYGGEEFVVLATGTDLERATFVAEKVRTTVAETSFGMDGAGEPIHVTISIGVAEFRGDRKGFFDAADRALYRAKAAGKNCVVSAEGTEARA
jgi:diguanylate cyclase (GGDEF)-like protein